MGILPSSATNARYYFDQKISYICKNCEHFIGILPLNQIVGAALFAGNKMKVLVEYFEQIEVSISNCHFLCMDKTNVSLREKRLKMSFAAQSSSWIGLWKS